MDMNNDWVEDVKRWCKAGGATAARRSSNKIPADDDAAAFGYEAANPAVQARHWPDVVLAPAGGKRPSARLSDVY